MTVTDFTSGLTSTHELLVRLLACETGLLGVASYAVQYEALYTAYPALKELALRQLEQEVPCRVPASVQSAPAVLNLSGRDDGMAFAELFRGIELFVGPGTAVDNYAVSAVLTQWVQPLVARKVEANPELCECVLRSLNEHHRAYGAPVRERNLQSLKSNFRFSNAFVSRLN